MRKDLKIQVTGLENAQADQNSRQPLWKKLQLWGMKQQDCPSLKFFKMGMKRQNGSIQNIQAQNLINEPNINQFLLKSHQRISDSVNGSESQVMEKLSLDWGKEETQRILRGQLSRTFSIRNQNDFHLFTPKYQKVSPNSFELKEIQSLDQLLNVLKIANPNIFKKLCGLINEKLQLREKLIQLELKSKEYQQKIKKLKNELQTLHKKNNELVNDFRNLQTQVQAQIQVEQEKYKYKYEKIIQQMREKFDKQLLEAQKRIETSTDFTQNDRINEMKETIKAEASQNKSRTQSSKTPSAKKRGQFVRTNKNVSCRNKHREQSSGTRNNKTSLPNQQKIASHEYHQILWQIIRPSATKSLPLNSIKG